MEVREKELLIIAGDFNARIGGGRGWEINRKEDTSAMDKLENKEGEDMLKWLEEKGWSILNGNKGGNGEGKWKYHKSDKRSTIDYAVVNEEAWE